MNDIISNAIEDLLVYYVSNNLEFSIILDNHNDWDIELPERLNKLDSFRLNLVNTDLDDSYIDSNGDIILIAGIDDVVYTKVFKACDIHAIGVVDGAPLIVKQFRDEPLIKPLSPQLPSKEAMKRSVDALKKYNPQLFKRK